MIEIANQAVENMVKIKVLDKEMTVIRESTEKEISRVIWEVYRPKIEALKDEQDNKVAEVRKQGEAAENVKRSEIIALNEVVHQVQRTLDFLALDPHKNLDISDEDIQFCNYHSNPYKENLGFYIDDTYLKVKLYIVGNKKPTNKYSVVLLGKCLFDENLLKLDRNYGADFHTHDRYELEKTVKDFLSVELAKAWHVKARDNMKHLLSDETMPAYYEVKTAYDKAIQTYKVDDFQDLLLARCECGFFYTIWEDWIKRDGPVCRRCDKPMKMMPGK